MGWMPGQGRNVVAGGWAGQRALRPAHEPPLTPRPRPPPVRYLPAGVRCVSSPTSVDVKGVQISLHHPGAKGYPLKHPPILASFWPRLHPSITSLPLSPPLQTFLVDALFFSISTSSDLPFSPCVCGSCTFWRLPPPDNLDRPRSTLELIHLPSRPGNTATPSRL